MVNGPEEVARPSWRIKEGDAFDLIGDLSDDSVDLIITSPPYWGLRSYGLEHDDGVLDQWEAVGCTPRRVPPYDWYRSAGGQLGREPFPHWYVEHLSEFFARARRVLRPSGSVWINLGDTYFARWGSIRDGGRQGLAEARRRRRTPSGDYLHDKQLLMIPARCAIALQDSGWILRNDLIWAKPYPLPRPERDRLRLSHEHWFHFVLRNPGGRPSYYYDLASCEEGTLDVIYDLASCEEGALDVIKADTAYLNNGHTATFPPELIRPRILSSSPLYGLVLDPFCGTGTVIVEALRSGRNALGFEKQPEYAAMAADQVARAESGINQEAENKDLTSTQKVNGD